MAELGNLFLGGAGAPRDVQVDVEMLDYAYVNECNDWHKISAILDVLKSGREGYYPDLIRVTEARLVALLPPKEKQRYVSMNQNVTPSEIAEAEDDLLRWNRAVAEKEATLKQSQSRNSARLPPVRGTGAQNSKDTPITLFAGSSSVPVCAASDALLALLSANQRKKFEKLSVELDVSALSEVKRQYRAELEKTKGNESFRVADNQEAVSCYSRSLAYNPQSAVVWANRAMAYIRLELFDLAEADSSVALLLDPSYVKAYSRRGLVRFKRGKYAQAVQDFQAALSLAPDNAELSKLLRTAKDKYREVEGAELDEQEAAQGFSSARSGAGEAEEVEVEGEVAIERVAGPEGLLLPVALLPQWELLGQGRAESASDRQAAAPRFVRVSVVSEEDSSDEDEEESAAAAGADVARGAGGFNRVAIVEESESDSEGEREGTDDGNEGPGNLRGDSANDLKDRGNALLKENRAEEAVTAYTAALRLDPHFVAALNNRAQAHLVLKNYEAVVADCSAVLLREPGNAKALFRRASAQASLGLGKAEHRAQVLQDLSAVLAAEPGHRQAQELLARATAAASNAPALERPAAASVREQQAGRTLDVLKLKQQSQQLLGDGLNDKVISLLGPFLRAVDEPPFSELLQSDRTTLLHLLATAYASTADFEHAVAVQETILGIDPTNFRALYKRAEAQLQIAANAPEGVARTAALELAEKDIAAALEGQGANNTDVLTLRQKLLRLRNTLPQVGACQLAAAASPATGSKQQSDLQKEQGNAAMAEKHYANALQHYNCAIKLDSTNLAAYNNRALAHIKLRDYPAAEADAGRVIDCKGTDAGASEALHTLKLKALCRRAQARRAMAEARLGASDPHGADSLLRASVADLQELLKLDPTNKTALTELRLAREAHSRCAEALAPVASVGPASALAGGLPQPPPPSQATPVKPSSAGPAGGATLLASATAPPPPPPAPRADAQRISSLLGPSKAAASASAFGETGLIARATKRRTPANASSGSAADSVDTSSHRPPPVPAPTPASPAPNDRATRAAARSSPATSAPSVVLTSAPSEQPKTVYEFERVWRGLKGRPDLFAQYVCAFKKSTFKKVLNEALSPDLLSFMWRSVREYAPSTDAQLRVLAGFSGAPSFSLALSLLPAEDMACVAEMLARAQAAADALPTGTEEQAQARAAALCVVAELRATYRVPL